MKITPTWMMNFETTMSALIDDEAQRIVKDLIWDKFMDQKTSTSLRDVIFFLINSQRLHNEGHGGNKRFDDMVAHTFEITNNDFGAGLILKRNEILDNVMASGMPMLDYAAAWSTNMGALGARHPEDVFHELLLNGASRLGYDGVNFFSGSHPVNPYSTSGATYANLLTGAASGVFPGACPIDPTNAATLEIAATNFNKAVAYVESLSGPSGKNRRLKVKYALGSVLHRKRLYEILDTKMLATTTIENVVSRYGIEPIISRDIPSTNNAYWLVCEWASGSGGPFVYQNREDFYLTSFTSESEASLARAKQFEWHYDGRNGATYGHPYLAFEVRAT